MTAPSPEVRKPASLCALINAVDTARPPSAVSDKNRRLVYRGASDASWKLTPSLLRSAGKAAKAMEEKVYRKFCQQLPADTDRSDAWDIWCKGQHHGLPTRLLDWTRNPQVAMHFACDSLAHYSCDGVVWIADYLAVHERLPAGLLDRLQSDPREPFVFAQLKGALDSPAAFDQWASDTNKYLMFFENPSRDPRIQQQAGLFSIVSDPLLSIDDMFPLVHQCFTQVIVDKKLKRELRERLDRDGRTEARLFPDSADGLCRTIARQVMMGNDPEIN